MAYVVTSRCLDCADADCASVCPVACFYRTTSPAQVVIAPAACVDCGRCVPVCKPGAIYHATLVPAADVAAVAINRDAWRTGVQIPRRAEK